jgi:hypothetical protein
MADKKYLSKVKVGDQIYWVKDTEARDEVASIKNDYLPLTGGDLSGDVAFKDANDNTNVIISTDGSITAKTLILEDIQEKTTTIPNVLTLDNDDTIKYHSTDNFLAEIGGYSAKAEQGLLTLKLGKE